MPLYYFACSGVLKGLPCPQQKRMIMTPEEAASISSVVCPSCSGKMYRAPRPPTSRAVETLDNGIMNKRVERLVDSERLFAERSAIMTKKQQGEE